MAIVDPTTATSVAWFTLGVAGGADVFFRFYLYLTAYPTGTVLVPIRTTSAASVVDGGVSIDPNGKIRAFNSAGVGVGTAATTAMALNQWVRIEVRIRSSTTVGEVEWRLFNNADSVTATETQSDTALVLAADCDRVFIGSVSTVPTAPFTVYYEDFAVSTTTWCGPAPFIGFTNAVVPTVTGALAVGGTLTVSNGTWTPTPSSYNYYWHRADDALGTNLVEIGATGSTYTLSSSDLTKYIRAGVIPVQ